MPGVARLGDFCSGHQCWPPRPIISGSTNVLVNGKPAARLGDSLAIHACPPPKSAPHPGTIVVGCNTVLVNGQPLARKSDSVNCGSSLMQSSSNVNAGDGGGSASWSG